MDRLVLVANTHRVAPGLLSREAWRVLEEGPVLTGDPAHVQLPFLDAAGITVEVLRPEDGPQGLRVGYLAGGGNPLAASLAWQVRERARGGQAVWLAGPGGDPDFARALGDLVGREGGVELEVVYGSYDLPGARLLDLVATMDQLRSPGGCPWDAEQTHASLARYLVEETYESLDAIEAGDMNALRDELGDVLLQVVFHARVAQEREDGTGWTVDDVAGGVVEKLVRRHPHVFGDVAVSGAGEVVTNWEAIKDAERGADAGPFHGVALGQPALALAAKLAARADRHGLDVGTAPLADAAARAQDVRDDSAQDAIGALLWSVVALAHEQGVDPEAALRAHAKAVHASASSTDEPESWSVPDDSDEPDDGDEASA